MIASDVYGINSKVCKSLIRKTCDALDFAKSGVPPAELTTNWEKDTATGADIPPERSTRQPDFKKREDRGSTYASSRIRGIIHRSNRQLPSLPTTDVPPTSIKMNPIFVQEYENESKKLDPATLEQMESAVRNELNIYNSRIKGIRDNYGVMTEGELFSGCILHIQNKLGEREEDDGSNFTTTTVVRRMIESLFREQRERFFEEAPGDMKWLEVTRDEKVHGKWESENVLRRTVQTVSPKMRLKALMYYILAYRKAIDSGDHLISFGWVAWDVLAKTQQTFIGNHPEFNVPCESFHETLSCIIKEYVTKNGEKYKRFFSFAMNWKPLAKRYARYGDQVMSVLFVLTEWAQRCGIITNQFTKSKFVTILLLASSKWPPGKGESQELFAVWDTPNLDQKICSGQLIAKLMERLASRRLLTVGPNIHSPHTSTRDFTSEDWKTVHEAARKSFYALCIHQKLDDLVGTPGHMEAVEREVMIIELPAHVTFGNYEAFVMSMIQQKLKEKTGVAEIALRKNRFKKFNILYRANADAEEKLRRLVQLELGTGDELHKKEVHDAFADRIFENIFS